MITSKTEPHLRNSLHNHEHQQLLAEMIQKKLKPEEQKEFIKVMNTISKKGFQWWFEKLSVVDLQEVSNLLESGVKIKSTIPDAEKRGAATDEEE